MDDLTEKIQKLHEAAKAVHSDFPNEIRLALSAVMLDILHFGQTQMKNEE